MDVAEIRAKKAELEKDIAELLAKFEGECKVSISGVSVQVMSEANFLLEGHCIVKVGVIL